jgi:Tol biopolymer transport system component
MRPTYLPPRRLGAVAILTSALLTGLVATTIAARSESAPPPETDLVFTSDRDGDAEIYAMRTDGRLQRRLTVNPAADVDPAVSRHGLVVFASDRGGDFDLYAMSAEGRAVTPLTSLLGDETEPAFSPDGSEIAFSHGGDVYVMNANGRRLRNLTRHPARDSDPTWSPSGERIAFSSDRGGSSEIFVMRLGQKRATAVTHSGSNSAPDWSPDGTRIAFEHGDAVHVVPNAGGTEAVVASGVSEPAFSPDGTELALADGRDVVRISLADHAIVNLSFSAAVDGLPDWRGGTR